MAAESVRSGDLPAVSGAGSLSVEVEAVEGACIVVEDGLCYYWDMNVMTRGMTNNPDALIDLLVFPLIPSHAQRSGLCCCADGGGNKKGTAGRGL